MAAQQSFFSTLKNGKYISGLQKEVANIFNNVLLVTHSSCCGELHNWFLARRPKIVETVVNRLERQSYSIIQNSVVIQTRSHQRDYLKWGSKNAQCGHNKHTVKQNTGRTSVKHHHPRCWLAVLTKHRAASWICVPGVHQDCLCPALEHCWDRATERLEVDSRDKWQCGCLTSH